MTSPITEAIDRAPQVDKASGMSGPWDEYAPRQANSDGGDIDRQCAYCPRNDLGNAWRLIIRYGHRLVFVRDVGWFAWVGTHWSYKDGERVGRILAHETAQKIRTEAGVLRGDGRKYCESEQRFDDRIKSHRKWSSTSGNSGRVRSVLAEAEPYLTEDIEGMDTDPYLLKVLNGTMKLRCADHGGIRIRPHDPADRITRICPVAYDEEAGAPAFRKFRRTIMPDPSLRIFLQTWFGYSATGDTAEQCLSLLHGTGANGKSTLIDLIGWVMGDYFLTLPFASLLHDERRRGSEASPDLARLPGARLVSAAEPEVGARFSESLLKSLTGGDRITVRHLNKGFFEFMPQFKLTLSFNNKPSIRGQDEGIWRRLLMVPFTVTLAREDRDRTLPKRLKAEGSGVLNWILDGTRIWLEKGFFIPEAVRAATDDYRTESDPVGQFLTTCTREEAGALTLSRDLYQAYQRWCAANALTAYNQTVFGKRMTDKGYHKKKTGIIHYIGLELIEDNVPDQVPPPEDLV